MTDAVEEGSVAPYTHAAAGWGAIKQVTISLVRERVPPGSLRTLFKQNQPHGFDCPGCAWLDRLHTSTFEFCENGVKAVAAEATSKRVTREFFLEHSVEALMKMTDHELEGFGRLTEPMAYDAYIDRYVPISWEGAC